MKLYLQRQKGAIPHKICTAPRIAAVTPARKRVDGQQVFRAVGFLMRKAEAAVQKGG